MVGLLYSCADTEERRVDSEREEAGTPSVETPSQGVPPAKVALVPVAHLTSERQDVGLEELSDRGDLAVPEAFEGSARRLLDRSGFQVFDEAEGVLEHVSQNPGTLGVVPWSEVDPRVRALSVGGQALLGADGPDRDYPLAPEGAVWPEERVRTVAVGGDIWLDRGMPHAVYELGLGESFPLDGGLAAVTWRRPVESEFSENGVIHDFRAERRGEGGAVREYLNGADLTLANLECPVLADATYHPEGTVFEGDLDLLPVLQDAGIDGVTLGNNHILDADYAGLEETLGHLDEAGIGHAGAGMDLASAREPMVFDLDGVKVGVLSYQGVPGYEWSWARKDTPGTAPLEERLMRQDVERLRGEVDVVVVMPHWGEEYAATPEPGQTEWARAAVEAGADAVVGGHAHWVKGMEIYEEQPVYYGVGNFLADQTWSEETSTGILVELTLHGDRVVQSRPVPFLVMDFIQPNFLIPEGGGQRALDGIYAHSLGPEFEG
jgi:hypothetical protein